MRARYERDQMEAFTTALGADGSADDYKKVRARYTILQHLHRCHAGDYKTTRGRNIRATARWKCFNISILGRAVLRGAQRRAESWTVLATVQGAQHRLTSPPQ